MRPLRPSSRSAISTISLFGVAVGERARMVRAISASSRVSSSRQAAMKAAAVERLTPA